MMYTLMYMSNLFQLMKGVIMKETNVAELRKHTKSYFDAVERGNIVRVYRKGQPIADIIPIRKSGPAWKKEIPRLTIPGVSITQEILKDRSEADS